MPSSKPLFVSRNTSSHLDNVVSKFERPALVQCDLLHLRVHYMYLQIDKLKERQRKMRGATIPLIEAPNGKACLVLWGHTSTQHGQVYNGFASCKCGSVIDRQGKLLAKFIHGRVEMP
ncbi:hypothetical protein Tcan_10466 [Toxocara canis]|uniref:Uncharacterized protein n=1 Tax=Toxocara canis TaxID=6265 RepID=A0A0B2V103_TOXCA|nr:hypothetical protein Tcan_10466 [Toxocara canis]